MSSADKFLEQAEKNRATAMGKSPNVALKHILSVSNEVNAAASGLRDLLRIMGILAMGFTVPAIAIDAALPGGAMQEAARMGLVLSLLAGVVSVLLPRQPDTSRSG